jgi:hypothetical protein
MGSVKSILDMPESSFPLPKSMKLKNILIKRPTCPKESKSILKNDIFERALETLKRCPKNDLFKKIKESASAATNMAILAKKRFETPKRSTMYSNGKVTITENATYVLSIVRAILFFPISIPYNSETTKRNSIMSISHEIDAILIVDAS